MLLEIKNSSFSYFKNKPIIKNLSFCAQSGDLIAILGPNGAGKTTLLKCIMGFLKLDNGFCSIDGKDIRKIPSKKFWNKVSYVPQAKGNESTLLVEDAILLGMTSDIAYFSTPHEKERVKVKNIAETLGITYLLDRKCNRISGGELQMVLIARALASEPQIIILDEPESNLDFRNQLIVLNTLSNLAAKGMCVIFNTHYPEHALTRANKSLIIDKSGQTLFGNTETVVTENNIKRAFGVNTIINEIETPGNVYKNIIPLEISDYSSSESTLETKNAIAVVSAIFSNYSLGERINEIFAKYGNYIIGRMGMPYPKGNVYIINLTLDAPINKINNLKQELSVLPEISVKVTISNK